MTVVLPIEAECPYCGHPADCSSEVGEPEGDAKPEPGDMAVCIACADIGIYTLNPGGLTLGIRAATTDEKVQLSEREDVQLVQEAIRRTVGKWLS